jgi:hypothetical protein
MKKPVLTDLRLNTGLKVTDFDPTLPSEMPSLIYSRQSKRLFVSDTKELRIVSTEEAT